MKKQNSIALAFLYITTFLVPFYFFRFDISSIGTNIFEIFVLISLILTLFLVVPKKLDKKTIVYSMLIIVAALISTAIAPDKTKALGILKGWIVVPMILAYCFHRNIETKNIGKAIIPLYVSILLISLWVVLQRYGIIHELFYQVGDPSFAGYFAEKRSFGPFESPNYLAMFLVPATFLSLAIWRIINKSLWRMLFAISLVLPIAALYFSGSRGGLIAFLIGAVIFLLFNQYCADGRRERLLKAVLIIISLIIALFAFQYYLNSKTAHEGGDNIRREIYSYSTTMVKESPVLGIGLGNFQNKIDQLSKPNGAFQLYGIPFALHPHNLYLAMWLNLGLLGILSFALLVIYLFVQILRIKDSYFKAILLAVMAAILVHGLVDTTYFKNDLSAIFWLMVSFVLITRANEKNA